MKDLEVQDLSLEGVKVISYGKYKDNRGYFTETYRKSCYEEYKEKLGVWNIVQINESYSEENTLRGLHFQWNPYMGKLVRTISGTMIDLVLDIRKGSETYGNIIAYKLKADPKKERSEWIWIPPGFAHGNFFKEETVIEYCCSGEYSHGCEACISPMADDINWSLCDNELKKEFDELVKNKDLKITEKDKNGLRMREWEKSKEAKLFQYNEF